MQGFLYVYVYESVHVYAYVYVSVHVHVYVYVYFYVYINVDPTPATSTPRSSFLSAAEAGEKDGADHRERHRQALLRVGQADGVQVRNAGEFQPSDVVSSDQKFLLPRDGAVLDICVVHARIAGELAVVPPDTVLPSHGTGKVQQRAVVCHDIEFGPQVRGGKRGSSGWWMHAGTTP